MSALDTARLSPVARPAPEETTRRTIDRVSAALLISDLLAVGLACLVASVPLTEAVLLGTATIAALQTQSLYASRLTLSVADQLPAILGSLLASLGVTGLVTGLTAASGADAFLWLSCLLAGLTVTGRAATAAAIRAARSRGWVHYRALVMGCGPTAARVARVLDDHPEHGLRVVGFIGSPDHAAASVVDRIVEEDYGEMAAAATQREATVVVVVMSEVPSEEVLQTLRDRDTTDPRTLFMVPPMYQLLHTPHVERVRDVAMLRLRASLLEVLPARVKRLFDVVVALACVLVLSPVMVVTALAVRMELGPQILFRQTRVGRGGRPFTLYKFTSLRPASAQESSQRWSVHHDDRIGAVGRFIRKTSIDELPQLFNVLRGDMSLVGPRPERPHFVAIFDETYYSYSMRHRVRPGLTGLAAVHGLRGDTSIEDRCILDNVYIDNWSLWLDVKILLRTALAVVGGQGA
jgi:exopolysaccharide biosynthesis polyprenyl glycosylphosphotransferase